MRKIAAFQIFTIAVFILIGSAKAETVIPSTISKMAQDYIRDNEVAVYAPKSVEEWRENSGATSPPGELSDDDNRIIKLWPINLKLMSINNVQHLLATPVSGAKNNRIIIYAHGGAYVFGSPENTMGAIAVLANRMNVKVLGLRYPLAWKAPFPAARDRLVEVYKELLKTHSPQSIAMAGDSAGGGLVMTSVLKIRDDGLPMPAVLGLVSPWADISKTGDSMTIAAGHDPLINYDKNLAASAKLYANGIDLRDSRVSPIYSDFTLGFPPTIISSGTRDHFLSHAARLQRKLTDAGVENSLRVHEGMWHVFQLSPDPELPEAGPAWSDFISFFDRHMAR